MQARSDFLRNSAAEVATICELLAGMVHAATAHQAESTKGTYKMRSRKPVSAVLASALLWGALAAVPGSVLADDVRGNKKNQGKSGDRCTSTSDCQQKPAALSCIQAGDQMQCLAPPPPPPPIVHKVT